MTRHRPGPKPQGRPKLVFKTPGHECAHADKGACPNCHDPFRRDAKNMTYHLGRHLFKHVA